MKIKVLLTNDKEAVAFCKENYANYLIAVEKCDKEVYESV